MAFYTFKVRVNQDSPINFDVDIDDSQKLMDSFCQLIDASAEKERPIPAFFTDDTGREQEIIWSFAWNAAEGDRLELAHDESLKEQGVPEGAEIFVADISSGVGAPMAMTRRKRLMHDMRKLNTLVAKNRKHLEFSRGATPTTIELRVKNVKAIGHLNDRGDPVYSHEHQIRLLIPRGYPYEAPTLVPLTPVWHPNIRMSEGPEATVCYTEGYSPTSNDTFSFIVTQYVQMIQFQGSSWNLEEPHRSLNPGASVWLEKQLSNGSRYIPIKPAANLDWS